MNQVLDKNLERVSLRAGEYAFYEGDLDSDFYIVEEGRMEILTKNKEGKRVSLQVIEEGESFGEFALLDKQPRSASAQAITDCVVVKVSQAGYQQLLEELPIWASSMLRSFAKRLRNMNQKLKNIPQFVDYKK